MSITCVTVQWGRSAGPSSGSVPYSEDNFSENNRCIFEGWLLTVDLKQNTGPVPSIIVLTIQQ
jgi:hypothetical protein